MEAYDWKYIGKIAASVALSAIIGFFWISNAKDKFKITKPQSKFTLGQDLVEHIEKERALVIFWASWCETCKEDLTYFNELKQNHAELFENYSFLAVNADEVSLQDEAQLIWNSLEVSQLKLIYDTSKNLQSNLSVDLFPTYFLFQKNGKAILRMEGKVNWKDSKVLSLFKKP